MGKNIDTEAYLQELAEKFAGVRTLRYISALIFDVECISTDAEKPFDGYCENTEEIRCFLQFLAGHAIKTAIVSANSEEQVRETLKAAGLADCFDEIVRCETPQKHAPIEDLTYVKACARLGTNPREAYVLTRSTDGLRAACDARLHAIALQGREQTSELAKLSELMLPSLCRVQEYLEMLIS